MKRKFTFLIAAAVMLLTMVATTGTMWGQKTDPTIVASFSRSGTTNTVTGGDFTATLSAKTGYYQDGGTVGINYYMQIKNNSAYWTTTPTSITLTSSIGGGSGNKDLSEAVYAVLLDEEGEEILSSVTAITSHITTAGGDTYNTTIPVTNNVYGIKIYHVKESGYNVRFYSFSLSYVAGGGGGSTYTVTYNSNDATSGTVPTDSNSPYANGATVTVLDNTGNLAKTGNDWTCWNTAADGSGTDYSAGNTFTISANTTLYAKWTVHTHNITMPSADTYGTYTASATENVPYETEVTLTYTPASGYESYSATWSVNGTPIVGNTFVMPDEDVTVTVTVAAVVVYEWVPVAIGDLTAEDIFVIVGTNSGTFAMTNDNGTGSAPTASLVTIEGNKLTSVVADNMKWNISGNSTDGYTFYPNGSTTTWLYCNTTSGSGNNNNMRVGTGDRKVFKHNASDYLLTNDNYTNRYVCVYSGQDWRGYTSASTTIAYYKRSVPAAVETPTFSVASGIYNSNQSVTITCATDGATIYYTTDGSTPTSSSTAYSSSISITQTTTLKAIAIKGDDESNVASATYTMKCATPTFSPVGGAYTSVQNVTISCTSPEVSIYYTLDGTTPTNASTLYNGAISINETKTLKAIALKDNWSNSEVASATYTIDLALTTMDEIFAKANAVGSTLTDVNIAFNNWVISGVSGSTAYLTDGTKGCIIYQSGHGFAVGNILSGTAACQLMLYNNAAEIKSLKSNTSGLTVNTGGTINPTTTTIAGLTAVNTGAVYTISDLIYTSSTNMLSDGVNNIKLKNNLYNDALTDVENGKKYTVTGVFVIYGEEKQIYPRETADIEQRADMSLTDFSGLTTFTYVVGNGPSTEQHIDLLGEDFSGDLTVTASGDYEVSTDNTTYSTSVVVTQDEGNITEDLYVRLKSGLATGTHNGTLTFTATNLTTVEQNLTGNVSENQTYAITLIQPSYATIAADFDVAEAGETVTLSYSDLDDCYNFTSWSVYKTGDQSTTVTVNGNEFTMPDYDVTATATLTQKTFTVNYSVNGVIEPELIDDNISCGNEAALWDEDDLESAGVAIPSGFDFVGWSASVSGTIILNSFIPTENTTLYAVLLPTGATTNYVKVTENLTDWSGEYLIVYETDGVALDGSINNTTYDKTSNNISVTITNGKIASTNTIENSRFIVEKDGDDYTLKSAAGYYIGRTDNSTGINASTSVHYTNTFSISEGNVVITASNSYVLRYNASDGQNRFRYYAGNSVKAIQIYRKEVPVPYTYIENITSTTAAMTNIEEGSLITVEDGGILTLTGTNNGTAANLVIEDGGQVIVSNAGVQATMMKTIAVPTKDGVGNWYTISTPVNNVAITSVTNLVLSAPAIYDLYRYNEAETNWENYKASHDGFNSLTNGRGYLYYNSTGSDLSFPGELNSGDVEIAVTKTGTGDLAGFNLIGNPYSHNIYKGAGTAIPNSKTEDYVLSTGFYTLSNEGAWTAGTDNSTAIKPGQGILVKATTAGTVTMANTTANGAKRDNEFIKFIIANSQFEDVAYAMFSEEDGLDKINHRNASIPMLYIAQNEENYAIATMSEETQSFNLNFKAMTTGQYTLSYKAEGNYDYLHVIDRLTGEDVDMLLDGEYSFIASPIDNDARFIVKLGSNANGNAENDIFAYQNGNDIIVNGEGELQVFDMMGRMIATQHINGVQTVNMPSNGVYIFKLNEKTQKIVVR